MWSSSSDTMSARAEMMKMWDIVSTENKHQWVLEHGNMDRHMNMNCIFNVSM